MRLTPLVLIALALCACTVKKIPGTDIDDTGETRLILDVLTKYRVAFEARNVDDVVKLTDPGFHDDHGTATLVDDWTAKNLSEELNKLFAQVDEVRVDITVRKVEFDEEQNNAKVTYRWSESYRQPAISTKTKTESDIKQVHLKKAADRDWKIVSGI